jgi:hypothetical protein
VLWIDGNGFPKRKTPRSIQVKADDGAKSLSVTVPVQAFELFLEVLDDRASVLEELASEAQKHGLGC